MLCYQFCETEGVHRNSLLLHHLGKNVQNVTQHNIVSRVTRCVRSFCEVRWTARLKTKILATDCRIYKSICRIWYKALFLLQQSYKIWDDIAYLFKAVYFFMCRYVCDLSLINSHVWLQSFISVCVQTVIWRKFPHICHVVIVHSLKTIS
jgi:hypothetical protein